MITKNLGIVAAIFVGSSAPSNIKMLWYNTSDNLHYYYKVSNSTWTKLIPDTVALALSTATESTTLTDKFSLSGGTISSLGIVDVLADSPKMTLFTDEYNDFSSAWNDGTGVFTVPTTGRYDLSFLATGNTSITTYNGALDGGIVWGGVVSSDRTAIYVAQNGSFTDVVNRDTSGFSGTINLTPDPGSNPYTYIIDDNLETTELRIGTVYFKGTVVRTYTGAYRCTQTYVNATGLIDSSNWERVPTSKYLSLNGNVSGIYLTAGTELITVFGNGTLWAINDFVFKFSIRKMS